MDDEEAVNPEGGCVVRRCKAQQGGEYAYKQVYSGHPSQARFLQPNRRYAANIDRLDLEILLWIKK